jgi:hypothetical protein
MKLRTLMMMTGLSAAALVLGACGSGTSGGGETGGGGGVGGGGGGGGSSPTALSALEATANASSCDSFAPVAVNGTTYPADTAGEVPARLNGASSPLNCPSGN